MDEQRLISLRDEYQKNRDTYTPEQQEAMESKFWTLVQKAMAEKEQAKPQEQSKAEAKPRFTKAPEQEEVKPYRVTL